MSARGFSLHGGSARDRCALDPLPTLCVLLSDSECPVPAQVHGEIAARLWQTIDSHNPLDAMLRLCMIERTEAMRTAWGLARQQMLALLLPADCQRCALTCLAEAVQLHLPNVAIWRIGSGGGLVAINSVAHAAIDHAAAENDVPAPSAYVADAPARPAVMPWSPSPRNSSSVGSLSATQPLQPAAAAPSTQSIELARLHHGTRAERPAPNHDESCAIHHEPFEPVSHTVDTDDVAITRQEIAMLLEVQPDESSSL